MAEPANVTVNTGATGQQNGPPGPDDDTTFRTRYLASDAWKYGPFMNKQLFDQIFEQSPLTNTVELVASDHYPFRAPYGAMAFALAKTYAVMKASYFRETHQYMVPAVAAGEMLAPALPAKYLPTTDRARDTIIKVVTNYVNNRAEFSIQAPTQSTITSFFGTAENPREETDQHFAEADKFYNFPPEFGIQFDNVPLTIGQAMRVIQLVAAENYKNQKREAVELICYIFVALARRGVATQICIERIRNAILTELNIEIMFDCETLRAIYRNYRIDETKASANFKQLLSLLPLRVKLSLEQCCGSGLTVFTVLGRALRKYSDFNWKRVNELTGLELNNYYLALQAVGNDVFYGYRRDLGPAKSTNYKSAAYPAFELLIKINGERSLAYYKGMGSKIKEKAKLDKLVQEYIAHHVGNEDEGAFGTFPEIEGFKEALETSKGLFN